MLFRSDSKLNGKSNTFLPFGDPNKLINFYSLQLYPEIQFFDVRGLNYDFLKDKSVEFLNTIKASDKFQKEFQDYLKVSFDFFVENRHKLSFKRELCLGYIFHSFVLNKAGNVGGWNKYFQELKILPKNINLSFAYHERTVMVAKDISLVKLVGEDKIDHHDNPILPATVHLSSMHTKKSITELTELFAKINQSDCVLIPSGSITNWISILNLEGVVDILKTKKVLWLTNPYKSKNELDNMDYFYYFKSVGIKPIILKSRKDFKLKSKHTLLLNKKGRYETDNIRDVVKGEVFDD